MTTAESTKEKVAEKKKVAAEEDAKVRRTAAAAEESDDDESDDEDEKGADEKDAHDEDGDDAPRGARAKHAHNRDERDRAVTAAAAAREGSAGSFLRNTWTIARRETRSFFDSLVAYVVVGGSMIGVGIYFFLLQQGGFWQTDRASMARMFDFLPWALSVLVIPLVTMRALAEERRTGTIELLITMPVRDSEVVVGKWLAAVVMCVVLLLATLVYPLAMFKWPWHLGDLDLGPVWCAYFGLVMFSLAGTAIGILFSSITESQIIAFFFTAGSLVLLTIVGNLVESVHGLAGDVIAFVSFQTRYASFARGLLDTRAVVYFASVAVVCLLGAFRALESRKWK